MYDPDLKRRVVELAYGLNLDHRKNECTIPVGTRQAAKLLSCLELKLTRQLLNGDNKCLLITILNIDYLLEEEKKVERKNYTLDQTKKISKRRS